MEIVKIDNNEYLTGWLTNSSALTPLTVKQAVIGDPISLLNREHPEILNAVLVKLFDNASSLKMSEGQTIQVINDIKGQYHYFKVGEVALVIKNGVQGKFGNVPAGTSPVYYWFHQYDIGERIDHFQDEALKYKEPYEKQFEEIERKETQDFETAYQKQVKYLKAKKKAEDVNK